MLESPPFKAVVGRWLVREQKTRLLGPRWAAAQSGLSQPITMNNACQHLFKNYVQWFSGHEKSSAVSHEAKRVRCLFRYENGTVLLTIGGHAKAGCGRAVAGVAGAEVITSSGLSSGQNRASSVGRIRW